MSSTLDKQKIDSWLDMQIEYYELAHPKFKDYLQCFSYIKERIQSGAFDTDNQLQKSVDRAIEDLGDIIDLEPLEGHVREELTEIVGYLSTNSKVEQKEDTHEANG